MSKKYDLHEHINVYTYKKDLLNSFNHMLNGTHKVAAPRCGALELGGAQTGFLCIDR